MIDIQYLLLCGVSQKLLYYECNILMWVAWQNNQSVQFNLLFVCSCFSHLSLLLSLPPSPTSCFFVFPSVGVVATQLRWQEHPGRCCGQVLHRSPAHPVVGMDTAAPDLSGWLRRKTSAQPNQPGETFLSVKQLSYIILLFLFLNHLFPLLVTFYFVFFSFMPGCPLHPSVIHSIFFPFSSFIHLGHHIW